MTNMCVTGAIAGTIWMICTPVFGEAPFLGGLLHPRGTYSIVPEHGIVAICGEDAYADGYEEVYSVPGFPNEGFYKSLSGERAETVGGDGDSHAYERIAIDGVPCFYEFQSDVRLGFWSRYSGSLPPPSEVRTVEGYEFPAPLPVEEVSQILPLLLAKCNSHAAPMFDPPSGNWTNLRNEGCYTFIREILRFRTFHVRLVTEDGSWTSIPLVNGYFFYEGRIVDQW